MKFKQGDKVRIVDCSELRTNWPHENVVGKVGYITSGYSSNGDGTYLIDDNKYCINFTNKMLEKVVDESTTTSSGGTLTLADKVKMKGGKMKLKDLKHGTRVTCEIEGTKIDDAKIAIENERYFICQNLEEGSEVEDKLGYKYSWLFGRPETDKELKEKIDYFKVTNLKIKKGGRMKKYKWGVESDYDVTLFITKAGAKKEISRLIEDEGVYTDSIYLFKVGARFKVKIPVIDYELVEVK